MKKFWQGLIAAVSVVALWSSSLWAGEVDILIEKLVEKGVLTQVEASIIKDETKQQVSKEVAEAKSYALPSWVQKMKLKGDLRLRYQFEKTETSEARNRGRVRYRLGIESQIAKNLKVGAGLASGGDDARSTNQSFQDAFSTKDIRLDLAYAEYKPTSWVTLVGGKFKRKPYLWQTGDLLWDGDINPEGGSLALTHTTDNNIDLFLNAGVWMLDESSSDTSDPYLVYAQPGLKMDLADDISLKAAVAYYEFNSVQNNLLDGTTGTNAIGGDGALAYDYDSINPNVELAFKKPFDGLVPYASIFGGYIQTFDDDADDVSENTGWQAGFKFGDKKVKKPGQWQAKYQYSHLEKDAFPDAFPDSDRFGGRTDVQGHEVVLSYGLMKNVVLGLDYYYTERILAASNPQHLLQADVAMSF